MPRRHRTAAMSTKPTHLEFNARWGKREPSDGAKFALEVAASNALHPIRARIDADIAAYNRQLKEVQTYHPDYSAKPLELIEAYNDDDCDKCECCTAPAAGHGGYQPQVYANLREELLSILMDLAERHEPAKADKRDDYVEAKDERRMEDSEIVDFSSQYPGVLEEKI